MSVPAVNDLLLLSYRGTIFGQRVLNTYWWRISALNLTNTPTVETACNQLINKVKVGNAFNTNFLNCMPAEYTLAEIWAQRVFPRRQLKVIFAAGQAGTSGYSCQTGNLQASITRRSEIAARGQTGGVRLILPESSDVSEEGLLTAPFKATLGLHAADMNSDITLAVGTTITPVLQQTIPNPAKPDKRILDGSVDIVQVVVMPEVRTLRRRTVGRGE